MKWAMRMKGSRSLCKVSNRLIERLGSQTFRAERDTNFLPGPIVEELDVFEYEVTRTGYQVCGYGRFSMMMHYLRA